MTTAPKPINTQIEDALASLVKRGIVFHNGQYRPGKDGTPQPVYVARAHATPEQLATLPPLTEMGEALSHAAANAMGQPLNYGPPWEMVDAAGNVLLTVDEHYHDGAYQCTWPNGDRDVLTAYELNDLEGVDNVRRPVGGVDNVRLVDLSTTPTL